MATFTGSAQAFMGNIIGGAIDAITADIGASSTTYTVRSDTDPKLSLLVCDGNSWPFGSGVPGGSEFRLNYPVQCEELLRVSQASHLRHVWKVVNKGTGSIQTTELTARFEATVHPHYSTAYRKRIVHVQEYINHRRHSGATHNQALDAYLAYIAQAQAFGWEVMLCTIPPTGPLDPLVPGGLDTSAINTYLRDNIATLSPYPIVDFVAAGMDDPTDTLLWNADQVHHNTAGATLCAQTLHDVVAAIAA